MARHFLLERKRLVSLNSNCFNIRTGTFLMFGVYKEKSLFSDRLLNSAASLVLLAAAKRETACRIDTEKKKKERDSFSGISSETSDTKHLPEDNRNSDMARHFRLERNGLVSLNSNCLNIRLEHFCCLVSTNKRVLFSDRLLNSKYNL
ncbi:hypothetical protein CEXT_564991 [Caerostris extrusa]|uniref:Uncharacterized protein n=1 Tax=Caerostris extrusa TaxID=172846 RepID=A0AAV4RIQ6_CAEEX|nr:hypothetical protein CEXT_564991 [Caerostris extrusa]